MWVAKVGDERWRVSGRELLEGAPADDSPSPFSPLQAIADAGLASRRAAVDMVTAGRVKVNGAPVAAPATKVWPGVDAVSVDGKPLPAPAPKLYFAVNKPKGYHCTSEAGAAVAQGGLRRRLVTDLLEGWVARWRARPAKGGGSAAPTGRSPTTAPTKPAPRLFTVGRLDAATTGLILVTNDGDWANKIAHPSSGVTREYVATLARAPSRADLERMAAGVEVEGETLVPVAVMAPPKNTGDAASARRVRIVVGEGRNREVRQLVAAAGHECASLKRVRVGGLRLPADLGIGEIRQLQPYEAARAADVGLQSNPDANPFAV